MPLDHILHIESVPYRKGDSLPDISVHVEEVVRLFEIPRTHPLLDLTGQIEGITQDEGTLFHYRVLSEEVPVHSPQQIRWEREFFQQTLQARDDYAEAFGLLREQFKKGLLNLDRILTDAPESIRARIDSVVQGMLAALENTSRLG